MGGYSEQVRERSDALRLARPTPGCGARMGLSLAGRTARLGLLCSLMQAGAWSGLHTRTHTHAHTCVHTLGLTQQPSREPVCHPHALSWGLPKGDWACSSLPCSLAEASAAYEDWPDQTPSAASGPSWASGRPTRGSPSAATCPPGLREHRWGGRAGPLLCPRPPRL